jgi:hypothetical protein
MLFSYAIEGFLGWGVWADGWPGGWWSVRYGRMGGRWDGIKGWFH